VIVLISSASSPSCSVCVYLFEPSQPRNHTEIGPHTKLSTCYIFRTLFQWHPVIATPHRLSGAMLSASISTRPAPGSLTSLTTNESWFLHSICAVCVTLLIQTLQGDGAPLTISLGFSGLAFATTYALIRWLGASFMRVRKLEMCVQNTLAIGHFRKIVPLQPAILGFTRLTVINI
jgi:hypothetical protein